MIIPGIIFGLIVVKILDIFFKLELKYYFYSVIFSLIPQLDFAITFFYEKNRFDFKEFLNSEKKGIFLHNINGFFVFLVISVFIFFFS